MSCNRTGKTKSKPQRLAKYHAYMSARRSHRIVNAIGLALVGMMVLAALYLAFTS